MPKTFITTARNAHVEQVTPKQLELLRALQGPDRDTWFEGAKLIVHRHSGFGHTNPEPQVFQARTAYDLRDRGLLVIPGDGTGRVYLKDGLVLVHA